MKHLVRVFLFNMFGLWFTSQLLPPLVIVGNWQSLVTAGFVLSILMLTVQPLLKILFIPINIMTFGLLSWLINVIVLYLLTVFVSEVRIHAWLFPGITWSGFVIPSVAFSYTLSLIICALTVTFFTNLLHTISEG